MTHFLQILEVLNRRGIISRRRPDEKELLVLATQVATGPLPAHSQSVLKTENKEHSFVFERPTRADSSMQGYGFGEISFR